MTPPVILPHPHGTLCASYGCEVAAHRESRSGALRVARTALRDAQAAGRAEASALAIGCGDGHIILSVVRTHRAERRLDYRLWWARVVEDRTRERNARRLACAGTPAPAHQSRSPHLATCPRGLSRDARAGCACGVDPLECPSCQGSGSVPCPDCGPEGKGCGECHEPPEPAVGGGREVRT